VAKSKTDHVRLIPPGTLFCAHCGEHYEIALPAPIDVMAGASEAFAKTHKKCKLGPQGVACSACFKFGHPREGCDRMNYAGNVQAWFDGPDTGMSSRTLALVLTKGYSGGQASYPYDPDDFGRCYRFLKAFPHLRTDLRKMREVPGWAGLIGAWDELEKLWEEESPTGKAPKLYERMKQLEGRA
jgi:hypothetical protein